MFRDHLCFHKNGTRKHIALTCAGLILSSPALLAEATNQGFHGLSASSSGSNIDNVAIEDRTGLSWLDAQCSFSQCKRHQHVVGSANAFPSHREQTSVGYLQRKNYSPAETGNVPDTSRSFRGISPVYLISLSLMMATLVAIIGLWVRKLRQHALALEKAVLLRSKEIDTHKKAIESLLSKKDELFATTFHELRTPLTLIAAPITQILNESCSEEFRKTLAPSLFNTKRLLRMVDQLHDLARLDSKYVEKKIPVNLSIMLERVAASMQTLFDARQLSIAKQVEPGLLVKADRDGIEKIIVNLLSNAIKYTPRGGHIKITANEVSNRATFSINDNGPGIPKEDHSRIFERFERLGTSSDDPLSGAGIGLALVKQLVLEFDGQINLESICDSGTCFTVSFLRLTSQVFVQDESTPPPSGYLEQEIEMLRANYFAPPMLSYIGDKTSIHGRATVLIVEDHVDMRNFLQERLADNYRCLLAEDGLAGIKTALQEVPNLIVTALVMPKKSGFELARVIRDDTRTSHIPIIMLTGKVDETSRMQAWRNDIDDYIEKPFNAEEILLRCENLMSIRRIISQRLGSEKFRSTKKNPPILNDKDQVFIKNLKDLIAVRYKENGLTAKTICKELAMSESQLQRKIKALFGQSIPDYIRTFRLQKGAELLKQGGISATEVAYITGFSSPAYFGSCFKIQYGMTPKTYQTLDASAEYSAIGRSVGASSFEVNVRET